MSEVGKPSTLPWRIDYDGTLRAADNRRVNTTFPVNAALIVRAVNEREGLVRALESLAADVTGVLGCFEDELRRDIGDTNYTVLRDKVEATRRVLAKARE